MEAPSELENIIVAGRSLRTIDDGIWSVLSDAAAEHHYDSIAAAYDRVVGTRPYNNVMWGTSPADYQEFARNAVMSCSKGRFLDAGCGSLLFTARSYLGSERTIIAFDQSLTMLKRARERLAKLSHSLPKNIYLIQADLNDIPFQTSSFDSVLCLNVLHQIENAGDLISKLNKLRTSDGRLFLTSLVLNSRLVGDLYLKALYAFGEFVEPLSSNKLKELTEDALGKKVAYSLKGNMAFVSA
jgi:ubiquinone/menaquinone biosynthesis C-methylase UbiE